MVAPSRKPLSPGRPKGSTTFDEVAATAFGIKVRAVRTAAGIAQEQLAHAANMERSYLGRIERGQSQPTLNAILKIALALGCDAADLVSPTEQIWRRDR